MPNVLAGTRPVVFGEEPVPLVQFHELLCEVLCLATRVEQGN
jgi:hypothetical protein